MFNAHYVALKHQVWEELKRIFKIDGDYYLAAKLSYEANKGGYICFDGKVMRLFGSDDETNIIKFCERFNIPWETASKIEVELGESEIPLVRVCVYPMVLD